MIILRAIIINKLEIIMTPRETLILKALEFKSIHSGASIDGLVDTLLAQNPEQADAITKNVCARIPKLLAERMEEIGSLLDLNKREMITLALNDFLAKAVATIEEFDAWPKDEEAK